MKILVISDEECPSLWSEFARERIREYDLIISCGDLKADYLSFLVSLARCPVLYVHGNHDTGYSRRPPEGCDCIDGKLVCFNGLRILGLGGCRRYHPGAHQYSEQEMAKRIQKLWFPLWRMRGFDILVTHAPARGVGDASDPAHRGFDCLLPLLNKYKPSYMLHGHVHMRYGHSIPRQQAYGSTTVINASERYVLEIPDRDFPLKEKNQVIWKNGEPKLPNFPAGENGYW